MFISSIVINTGPVPASLASDSHAFVPVMSPTPELSAERVVGRTMAEPSRKPNTLSASLCLIRLYDYAHPDGQPGSLVFTVHDMTGSTSLRARIRSPYQEIW